MVTEVTKPKNILEACRLAAEAASSWWADSLDLCYAEEEKRQDFKEILFTGIFWELLNTPDRACHKELLLVNENGPTIGPMTVAQKFVNIEDEAFPIYMEMWISVNEVRVRGSGPKVLEPEHIIYKDQF